MSLLGSHGAHRKCVQATLEFRRKQGVDRPLADHARLPRKIGAHDHNIEMCFPLGPGACMTGVLVRVVSHLDLSDIQSVLKGRLDAFCTIHRILQRLNSLTKLRPDIASGRSTRHIPRMTRRRDSIDLDDLLTEGGGSATGLRVCEQAGCELPGEFRAPKSRDNVREYIWFCLDHVRAYNSSWNYYAGMSEDEIETDRHGTTFWHRPTWPFSGKRPGEGIRDDFGFFESEADTAASANTSGMDSETIDALAIMKLSSPLSADAIKRRYKELVKQHHPDANGGDKLAEERL